MIYTFTLTTQELSKDDRFELIKDLYESILKNDPDWHFFFEEEHGDFLRVTDKFYKTVAEFLKNRSIKYNLDKEWIESLHFVKDNQDYFKEIFHLNSVLAVTYGGDIEYLRQYLFYYIDRFSHSLHNMLELRTNGITAKERYNLSEATLARAWYDGYRQYYKDMVAMQNKDK